MIKMIIFFLFSALLLAGQLITPGPQTVDCVQRFLRLREKVNGPHLKKGKFYFNGELIQFGAEIEYILTESPDIVDEFYPIGFSEYAWFKLSKEKRIRKVAKLIETKLGEKNIPLLTNGELKMDLQTSGNLEIRGLVFDDLNELNSFVNQLNKRFGKGSIQLHASVVNNQKIIGSAGYTLFESDLSQLYALERGYSISERVEGFTPGKNILHPALGPVGVRNPIHYLENEKNAIKNRDPIFPDYETSRAVNSVIQRANIYPKGRIGWELRQFHKRHEEAFFSLRWLAHELESEGDLKRFKVFENLNFSHASFAKFSKHKISPEESFEVIDFIGQVSKLAESFTTLEIKGASYFERFLFPLRPWEDHPIFKTLSKDMRELNILHLQKAQKNYFKGLMREFEKSKTQKINDHTLQRILVLMARFADRVKLTDLFHEYKYNFSKELDFNIYPMELMDDLLDSGIPRRVKADAKSFKMLQSHVELFKNSIEVLFDPPGDSSDSGHISLRIGHLVVSLESMQRYEVDPFQYPYDENQLRGYLFRVDKKILDQVFDDIIEIYDGLEFYNLPSFHASSIPRKVVFNGTGYQYNNKSVFGPEIIEANQLYDQDLKRRFLKTENDLVMYDQGQTKHFTACSFSCASMVTMVLENFFGIEIPGRVGAIKLATMLEHNIQLSRSPDLIIYYGNEMKTTKEEFHR